ncbi:MAG: PHP domain-containing protein [Acidobacteriaceae bacterium]|nr:PHP domain-containing protein [Acidobacteriaceae bacterium]
MIDLHTHTNESDGSLSPEELVLAAVAAGLDALAITDHDTFSGYEKALPFALRAGLPLFRGIELNTRLEIADYHHRYAHILGYFPADDPSPVFLNWLNGQREDRLNRNIRLAQRLRDQGIEITIDEVEAQGKSLAGRPHFARVLVEKGYASDPDDAFRRYIGEDAPTFVERQSQSTEEVVQLIRAGGGIPVVAHPVRLSLPHDEMEMRVLRRLKDAGLMGLEIYHSEHSPDLQRYYSHIAEDLDLLPSGGSDFHGAAKPDVALGTGRRRNVNVPLEFLDRMREAAIAYATEPRA